MLEIETVGVRADREMKLVEDSMQGMGVTVNDQLMQSRILTPAEQVCLVT